MLAWYCLGVYCLCQNLQVLTPSVRERGFELKIYLRRGILLAVRNRARTTLHISLSRYLKLSLPDFGLYFRVAAWHSFINEL